MRILVVGASGYIGSRLVPLLAARGHPILTSRDARPLTARFAHATVAVADLLDPRRCRWRSRGSTLPTTWRTRWERVNGCSWILATGRQRATLPGRPSEPACRPVTDLGGWVTIPRRPLPPPREPPRDRCAARRAWCSRHRVPGGGDDRIRQRVVRDPAPPDRAPTDHDDAPLGGDPLPADRHRRRARPTSSGARSTTP